MALVGSRLPGFRPTETIFAPPDAFRGPGTAWIVGSDDGAAVCCGGLRSLADEGVGEIKRMFVSRAGRGRGHGTLLAALEDLAGEAGYTRVRLFTTDVLVEARALYESAGYRVVGTVPDGDRTDLWLEKALPG
jgi:GNAT superfamily N-acetyltransferase